jgi:hypothetical protein
MKGMRGSAQRQCNPAPGPDRLGDVNDDGRHIVVQERAPAEVLARSERDRQPPCRHVRCLAA